MSDLIGNGREADQSMTTAHPKSRIRPIAAILLAIAVVLIWGDLAKAQFYFGKNKVQYTQFDWMVLATKRFDIYFYGSERDLAELTAESAERSYDILADRFNHNVERRIPLIIYSSPNFFSETNVVSALLPENVGGFTEYLKGRVVLPFNGSYSEFRRVLQHELVHVFTISKLQYVNRIHKKLTSASPPLWFTEGIAEFYSGEWDTDGDMIVGDLVLNGRLDNIDDMYPISGTYLMYKAGESFFHFLEEEYGTEYILRIFDNWWRENSFDDIMEVTFGKSMREIGAEWGYWLKKRYFPSLDKRELPDRLAVAMTSSGYNVKPAPMRLTINGRTENFVAFKGNRLGYTGLYMKSESSPNDDVETLLRGERSPNFESLHLLGSAVDATRDGRLVFSSKRYERDVLYVLDAAKRRIIDEYGFDSLYVISSPNVSPDGHHVVFSGCAKDGIHDLFLFDEADDRLTRLTSDLYLDADPVFTPDGRAVLFASDRGRHGSDGYMNLFVCRLEEDQVSEIPDSIAALVTAEPWWLPQGGPGIYPLTDGAHNDRSPDFSADGTEMLFTSDRDGRFNIHRRRADGVIERVTNVATGAFDPRFLPDEDELVFTAYQRSSFQIYKMPLPGADSTKPVTNPQTFGTAEVSDSIQAGDWDPERAGGELTRGAVKYRNRFSFDIAQSAVSFDAFYGTLGGFQTALTDILGNHQYFFLLANNAETKDEILKSFNVAVTYINREHRLNYGYGVYHLYDDFYDPVDGDVRERQYGAAGYLGYPLSKFRRVEASLFLRQSEREKFIGLDKREALLATQFLGFVQDNSLWDISGPIDGHRFMLAVGYTANLSDFVSFNRLAVIDARKYFRLGRYSAFAVRALGHFSSGEEPQRRYLGGSWDLRGYPRRDEYARNIVLVSNELRFPLIDALFVGFPIASLGFQGIRGALFFDAGNAWEEEFGRMQGSLGVGARVSLGYLVVLRFDWARRTDFKKIDNHTNFEFFFGWNF
ncbi:MAG: BamA/TamA family outer membrane protein [Candidatus Zixiibacteriota bacterium]